MIELTDVCYAYDGVPALRHVTAAAAEGETVALLGPNGAGKDRKSTRLNSSHP